MGLISRVSSRTYRFLYKMLALRHSISSHHPIIRLFHTSPFRLHSIEPTNNKKPGIINVSQHRPDATTEDDFLNDETNSYFLKKQQAEKIAKMNPKSRKWHKLADNTQNFGYQITKQNKFHSDRLRKYYYDDIYRWYGFNRLENKKGYRIQGYQKLVNLLSIILAILLYKIYHQTGLRPDQAIAFDYDGWSRYFTNFYFLSGTMKTHFSEVMEYQFDQLSKTIEDHPLPFLIFTIGFLQVTALKHKIKFLRHRTS